MMPLLLHKSFVLMTQAPIPRDIELPLPLGEWEVKFVLVLLFLLHILFVNLMVGGSVMSVFFEILGLTWPKYDSLAKKIGQTITVNKSLAVVLGVGPLLCINLAYTTYFYSANALTGYAWFLIIPLVTTAFLLSYLHKYSWERWQVKNKRLHLAVGGLAAFLFLTVPFIFLSNINLMLFPDKWPDITGFFTSLQIGNVFPRYFHFLSASMAITGLFLAGWFGRKKFPVEQSLPQFTRPYLRRLFYRMAFYITLAQLVFGPLLLFTLPPVGVTADLLLIITFGVCVVIAVLLVLRNEIRSSDERIGRGYWLVWGLLAVIVILMGTGRHVYREASLKEHRQLMADASDRFRAIAVATQMRVDAGLGAGEAIGTVTGEMVFQNCAACHAVNKVLAAPALTEIYSLYKGNPEGIVTWAKKPGKKRPQFTQMPSFAQLGEAKLELVAQYILDIASPKPVSTDDQPKSN